MQGLVPNWVSYASEYQWRRNVDLDDVCGISILHTSLACIPSPLLSFFFVESA